MAILKVTSYGEVLDDNKEVTLSPGMIKAIFADVVSSVTQGKVVKNVSLLMIEGDTIEIVIGESDLYKLEEVVGGYDWE